MPRLAADQILDVIHNISSALALKNAPPATHVLLDPTSLLTLQIATVTFSSIIDPVKLTVFGIPIIRVYKAHPYIALATASVYINEVNQE